VFVSVRTEAGKKGVVVRVAQVLSLLLLLLLLVALLLIEASENKSPMEGEGTGDTSRGHRRD
jgi:hypothetical protein